MTPRLPALALVAWLAACAGDTADAPAGAGGERMAAPTSGGTGVTGGSSAAGGTGGPGATQAGSGGAPDAMTALPDAAAADAEIAMPDASHTQIEPVIPEVLTPIAWPTDDAVLEVDAQNAFGTDVSGLVYQPASGGPAVLWASMNLSPAKLYRLEKSGGIWSRAASDGWSDGKSLLFPDGNGVPDAESVTKADWSAPIVYIGSERNLGGGASGTSRSGVLSYDTSAAGTTLTALREWNLTDSLPSVSANQGLEAVTFIPDAALVAAGLIDENADALYDPASLPEHAGGLFAVGLEGSSELAFFALGSDGGSTRVATAPTPLQGVMGLEYDRDVGYLWAYCDDTCGNRAVILAITQREDSPHRGHFQARAELMRPASLPNINCEGIAIAPESECSSGRKTFYWVEDGNTDGHVLRAGTIPCGAFL